MSPLLITLAAASAAQPVPNLYDGGVRPGEWATALELTEFSIPSTEEVPSVPNRQLAQMLAQGSQTQIACIEPEEAINPFARSVMGASDNCRVVEGVFEDGELDVTARCTESDGAVMDMAFAGSYTPLAMRIDFTASRVESGGFAMDLAGRLTAIHIGECPVGDDPMEQE